MPKRTPTALLPLLAIPLLAGCGPLLIPAVERLPPDQQQEIDGMWANMLAPPNRLDHDVLLDAIMSFGLISRSVDHVSFRADKSCPSGTVVMTVDFDRAKPAKDAFRFRLFDQHGRLRREETYSGKEVLSRIDHPKKVRTDAEKAEADREMAQRLHAVEAATQPAK